MKKQHLILVTLLFPIVGFSQPKDTLFIKNDSIYGASQSIFIEKNESSKFHVRLINTGFGEFDIESYEPTKT